MEESMYKIYSDSKSAWDAMHEAIADAKKSIYWELYIFVDDDAGQRFFDTLIRKAKAGVTVRIIVDSFGSFGLPRKRIQQLKQAGVDLRFFNDRKHRYRSLLRRLFSRTHRKILVVDEEIGFIGGVNVRSSMKDWLDIHVRLTGNTVHSLLRAFAKTYIISGGPKKNVKQLLKYKFRVAHDMIDFIYDDPNSKGSRARKKYTEALLKARERVILFSPYYFPDKKFLHALWRARKRGVKVDLLIPLRSDLRVGTYAAYAWFSLMHRLGVKVHLTDKMMHGKGVIVDDDWAMVGSSNIDIGSFFNNYEANVKISDREFVKKLKELVHGWTEGAKKIDPKNWEKRGRLHRAKEWIAKRVYNLLYPDSGDETSFLKKKR